MPTAICVECKNPFECSERLASQIKVCTPKDAVHPDRVRRLKDGTTRRIPCGCCGCVHHRRLVKNQVVTRKDYMTRPELTRFYKAARKLRGGYYAAFRIGVNAMLHLNEILRIHPEDLVTTTDPCYIKARSSQKRKKEVDSVDVDCAAVSALKIWIDKRSIMPGQKVFAYSRRDIQMKFKEAYRDAKEEYLASAAVRNPDAQKLFEHDYTIVCLRHTGIRLRAEKIKSGADLKAVMVAARHKRIETTLLYLPGEHEDSFSLFKRMNWPK